MYESKHEDLLPRHRFAWRLLVHSLYAVGVIAVIMVLGVAGNMWFESINLHDAVFNIALIVAGIGTIALPTTVAGKLFFSVYGIFVGLVFMATLGIVLAPLAHRVLHKLHLDERPDDDEENK
ncbi:two pore domain potassium channel family protein [Castellaniella sp.]|uniref:two pore domain potassium channel family protein n=1 Tax=Castellaniella sp. TaxID=1955812 RepID=UPI002AFEF34B|nr:two pore domain potassium channel family protein [Castellaniella sp.]